MKKLINTVLLVLSVFSLSAMSQLEIQTPIQQNFDVQLNGEWIATNVPSVTITDMEAGHYFLKIVKSNNGYGGMMHKPWFTLFEGEISIPANTNTIAMVSNNQFIIQQQTAIFTNNPYGNNTPPQYGQGNHHPSNGYPQGNPYGQQGHHGNGYGHPHYDNVYYPGWNYGQQNPYYNGNPFPNYPPTAPSCGTPPPTPPVHYGPEPMSMQQFQQLKNSINNQWFSSGQISVFQQALAQNYFTANQVFELVNLFTFSSDQLQVAKAAYTKTVDPQNYFVVYDALEFSSNVNELSAYIASL